MADDALAEVMVELAKAVEPLADAFESPDAFEAFMAELGWAVDDVDFKAAVAAFGTVPATVRNLVVEADDIVAAVDRGDRAAIAKAVRGLIPLVQSVTAMVRAFETPRSTAGLGATLSSPAFWERFSLEVFDHLLFRYLERNVPPLYAPLRLLGVLRWEDVADPAAHGVQRRVVDWDVLVGLAVDPARTLSDVYRWRTGFDSEAFAHAVLDAAGAFGFPVGSLDAESPALTLYYDDPPDRIAALSVPLYWGFDAKGVAVLGVALVLLPIPQPGTRTGAPVGLALLPEATVAAGAEIPLGHGASLAVSGSLDAAGGVALELRPTGVTFNFDVAQHGKAQVALRGAPTPPWTPIGRPGATRFEISQAHLSLGFDEATGQPVEVKVEAGLDAARLVIEPGDLDGFLSTILGGRAQQVDLSTVLAWSNLTGVTMSGRVGMRAEIPVHQTLAGVVTVDTVTVALEGDAERSRAVASVSVAGALQLGPLTASIAGVGIELSVGPVPKDGQGSLGPIDARLGFRPPAGAGLSLDNGPLTGGGFLAFDYAREEYTGALELSFRGLFDLTAIGLITTRMPDGSRGFSMVIVITASGFAPIQLGFGFTLTGVGGLVAIQRTVDVGVLQSGMRSGSLDAILFPQDPVKNAPQLLNTLRSVFPVKADRFVIGPMAQIGWGSPTIITIELAVIVEFPAPVRVVIVGRLQALLPDEKEPIVELRMDVLGVIDFDAGTIAVDATLRDSRILELVITGDMALRMSWGRHSDFALSAGGFHPRFTPPAGFPALRRISAGLARSGLSLRLETYLALTSNTVQLGAHVDLAYSGSGLDVRGHCGFDALVHFSPFHFEVDVDASVSVAWEGIHLLAVQLHLGLSGPAPWHAAGSATIDLGGLGSIHAHFDVTFGGAAPHVPPPVAPDVAALLHDALADARAWTAALPADRRSLVSAEPAEATGAVRLHPLSRIEVRQRVAPLGTTLTRFGNVPLPKSPRFDVQGITVGGAHFPSVSVTGDFAAAQFETLTDDEKLRRPSFEQMPAGAALDALAVTHGDGLVTSLGYETDVRTAEDPEPVPHGTTTLSPRSVDATLAAGAVARAADRGPERWAGARDGVSVDEPQFVLTSPGNLVTQAAPTTYTEAAAELDGQNGADGEGQVVPAYVAVSA